MRLNFFICIPLHMTFMPRLLGIEILRYRIGLIVQYVGKRLEGCFLGRALSTRVDVSSFRSAYLVVLFLCMPFPSSFQVQRAWPFASFQH